MSQRRGKKRTFAESEEGIAVKSIYKLTKQKKKRRRTNRTLSKQLQQIMGKATSAYMRKDLAAAKSLAQEIVKQKPKYPNVYDLLGKINEEQEEYSTALTAYQYYVTLQYPQKSIASETSRNLFHASNKSTDYDSEFDDDSDLEDKDDKNPTPQLIEKIAKLAIKSENHEMALQMIEKIESHYRRILHKINDSKNRNKFALSEDEISEKKQEMNQCLVNIYRQRVIIYKKLKRFDDVKKEYELIYSAVYRNNHPLLTSTNVDHKHKELITILQSVCFKSFNHSSYLRLLRYFDIFIKEDNDQYFKWLLNEMAHNMSYKQSFCRLLSMFVLVSMEMFRFKAILKYLRFFDKNVPGAMPFALSIKMGICLLWMNNIEEAMRYYDKLTSAPLETGYGGLYMLFADALIAKNMLTKAQDLMNRVQQIDTFKQPRIWLRFADYYTLQKKYDDAIKEYTRVIDTVSVQIHDGQDKNEENENILLSARLKLLQIYFIKHDEDSASKLIEIIEKYKEQHLKYVNAYDTVEDDVEDSVAAMTPNAPLSSEAATSTLKPQKRVRLNAQLTCYFDTGLFGSVLVPKQLLHLELLNIELRSQYIECLELFKTEQYHPYLMKCESKIIELFAICHEAPKLMTTVYDVEFAIDKKESLSALQWIAADEEQQIGAVVSVNCCFDSGVIISKWSQVMSIDDEDVAEYKLHEIKEMLDSAVLPIKLQFIKKQNIFPLLKQNRNIVHNKIYSTNHLGHVLKDSCVFRLVVFICKIWYQCECDCDAVSEYDKFKQIELILNIVNEAASSLNPLKFEFDHFFMAELHLLQANIYFNNNDFEQCYHALVRVLDLQPNNVNAMRYLYEMYRHLSHHPKIERTIKRQLTKRREQNELKHNKDEMIWHQLILGHTSFSKNSYDIAANTYSQIIAKHKDSPFMNLMLALTFLQHAMKRTTKQEKYLVSIQGIAFMKRYVKLSKNTTECLYNFARALHLLALYGCAQILYEKIIRQIKQIKTNRGNELNPIRRYAAYNLSKIYLRSGQYHLALTTLKQNIIV